MNYRLGKLSVFAGFAGLTLIACVRFISSLFSDPLLIPPLMGAFVEGLILLCWLGIVVGFCITFLEERGTINLLIAGGYGVGAVYIASNSFFPISLGMVPSLVLSLMGITAMFLWAYKMWRSNRIAAIAIIGGVLLSFSMSFVISFFASLFDMSFLGEVMYVVNIIESVAIAYAAYLDMQR